MADCHDLPSGPLFSGAFIPPSTSEIMFRHLLSRLDAMSLIAVLHRRKTDDEGVVRYIYYFYAFSGRKQEERRGENKEVDRFCLHNNNGF